MSATDPYVLYEGSTLEADVNGHRAATVVYRVPEALTAAAAVARFDANPALRQHPDDTTIPFDSRSAFRVGPEFRVSARFSTFGGGQLSTKKPEEADWYTWERGRRRVDQEVYMNTRVWRKPGEDETQKYEVWELKPGKTPEVRAQITLKRRITTETQSIFEVIDRAIGDIHLMPDGLYWQLVAADTVHAEKNKWDVSYTWEYDRGTNYPTPRSTEKTIAPDPGANDPMPPWYVRNTQMWRPAYYYFSAPIVPENPRTTPFGITFASTGEVNADGWRALPGTEVL